MKLIRLILFLSIPNLLTAQKTEIKYLSGTGADHTVDWEFYCSAGMNSGKWTTIAVPSCWEQQGFGSYNYGQDNIENRLNETGQYRFTFKIPSSWKNKDIYIVFEGVMTDAVVKINGKLAGPVHQGAFYQFKYDITKLVKTDKENQLEVLVKKNSDNETVSMAERKADYWVFGGIFRPVYLEAKPEENIQRVAIDAKANGEFNADVSLTDLKDAKVLSVEIQTLKGKKIAGFKSEISENEARISGRLGNPQTWTPETPDLYNAVFSISDKNGQLIHQTTQRFGFRTVEVRKSDGIYVNGERVKLKGVCRHTFHPRYGRTSSKDISIEVVNLIKDMNMNAVRMSHYPPDSHFLDVCDSLGLFVLDELAGWSMPPYDNGVGRNLLEEMIARDINHPSIILWDNGNEGGWNDNLDDDFSGLDIQKRKILHPWQDYDLTNTLHYMGYNYLSHDGFSKRKIFLPTEFLHGLYDGGLGAGLDDFWLHMWNDPFCAGGFLWVFADEAVERTDKNGELDAAGNQAPDGILGPYLEKEGSFYAIKEIWSPVFFEKRYVTKEFDGIFRIENRYHYTNLDQCRFTAEWVLFTSPEKPVEEKIVSSEKLNVQLAPSKKGTIKVNLPVSWQTADALRISAYDPTGRHIYTWSWPVKTPEEKAGELISKNKGDKPVRVENEDMLIIKSDDVEYSFSKDDGQIKKIVKENGIIPLSDGPVLISSKKDLHEVSHFYNGNNYTIDVIFKNGDTFQWIIREDGLLELNVAYEPFVHSLFAGITFYYPEANVGRMKWMGNGPYRVYKNRMQGTEFGVWEKEYNNTITGESVYKYPEFKGYHSDTYWAAVEGKNATGFKVYILSNDIFLRMLTPDPPKSPVNSEIKYPDGDISFLHGINAIGTKFLKTGDMGPQSGDYYFSSKKLHGAKLTMRLIFEF